MEGLLTLVSTSNTSQDKKTQKSASETAREGEASRRHSSPATTPGEALEILRSSPDYESLISTLRYIRSNDDFDITSPSPLAAQIVHILASDVVPNYWAVLSDAQNGKKANPKKKKFRPELELLCFCFRSVTGLNAILLQLKQCIQQSKGSRPAVGGPDITAVLDIYLQVVLQVLSGDETVKVIWSSIWEGSNSQVQQKTLWNDFLALVPGGKLLGVTAEAEFVINEKSDKVPEKNWISDGALYSEWLAGSLVFLTKSLVPDAENAWRCCGQLFSKSFRLGHSGKKPNSNRAAIES